MLEDQYHYLADPSYLSYEFVSSGTNGDIRKIVQYSKMAMAGREAYNLGFGDLVGGQISDTAVSNNGDMAKVLATVANTLYDFTSHYKDKWIYAKGSNDIRTILYQRKLRQHLNEISTDFEIYGLGKQGWEEFSKEKDYDGFLIKRK